MDHDVIVPNELASCEKHCMRLLLGILTRVKCTGGKEKSGPGLEQGCGKLVFSGCRKKSCGDDGGDLVGTTEHTLLSGYSGARCWKLTPIILATQEAEIRRIVVQSQPGQVVQETLSKKKSQKRAGGVTQDISSEFKPQYCKKNGYGGFITSAQHLLGSRHNFSDCVDFQ
jgi:hypothetical protein